MISLFRKFAKSPWALGLIALVAIGLLVTGGTQMDILGSLGPQHVISAGDRSIDQQEFRAYAERVRGSEEQRSGQPVTFEQLDEAGVIPQILDGRAEELGFLSWAWRTGVRPSAQLIAEQLRSIPAFFNQVTGQFDQTAYESALAQQNLTVAQFEEGVRDDVIVGHVTSAVLAGARVPAIYAALAAAQARETRDGRWFEVTQAMAGAAPAPTDAQLTAFLNENAEQLRRPEFRTVTLVLFNGDEEPVITDAQIEERYEFRREALSNPEQRAYITIPAASEAAAQRIAAAIRAGQSPEEVAEANGVSVTRASARARTQIPDSSVAQAVFSLQNGQVSDPIRTQVGFVVARVDQILPGSTPDLASVRDQIVAELTEEAQRAAIYERVEAYEAARNDGASLADAAQRSGARLVQLPPFTAQGALPNGQPLQAPPEVLSTAFSLPANGESEVVDAGQGQYFALRVDRIQPPALPSLADVRAPLAAAWTQRENSRRLSAFADRLASRIRGGEDLAAVAQSVGASVTQRSGVQATQEVQESLGVGVVRGLFGQQEGQIFTEGQADGRLVIGRVDEIRPATPADAAPLVAQIQPALSQQLVRDLVQTMAAAASRDTKVSTDLERARAALGLQPRTEPAAE
ncbi:MAG: peptidyl-prolyl cis-trans isomerase [Brevundimonas sp.]